MTHSRKRILWVDNAKAFGIIAVFFGHIIEQIFLSYSPKAHLQFKFIYSFHIPLFFILSGFFARLHDLSFRSFLKNKFLSRIVPVIFFSVLSLPMYMLSVRDFDIKHLMAQAALLLIGIPQFNFVIWFLVCLFTVEIINFFLFPFLHSTRTRIISGILVFYCIGWLLSWKTQLNFHVMQISKIWCIQQAVMAYSFYLFGYYIYRSEAIFEKMNSYVNVMVVSISALILFFSFNLNNGPFYQDTHQVVIVAKAIYGNPFFFPLTAIAGSLFVISFSKLVPESRTLIFLGRNTLTLMGLNGMLLFVNKNLVLSVITYISDSSVSIFVLSAILTAVSVVVCVPIVLLLNKYLPQLTGAPGLKGTAGLSISSNN